MTDSNERITSRMNAEKKTLLRKVGTALASILHGTLVEVPETNRRDELGLLCAMANRIGKEILAARKRDTQLQQELEDKLTELKHSYSVQNELLATIQALSSPLLHVHAGVLLVPIIGHMDAERSEAVLETILQGISRVQARVVILDLTSAISGDVSTATMISHAAATVRLLGVELILSGVSADFARVAVKRQLAFDAAHSYRELHSALSAAQKLVSARRNLH